MFINKNLLRYLLKFILSFCFLYYGTKAMIGLTSPGGYYVAFIDEHLNYVKWFRYALLYSSKGLLSISGYNVFVQNRYTLRMYNGAGVHLVYSCLGFGVMSFWAAFIFANKTSWQKKIIWVAGGEVMISFINIVRISLLLLSANKKVANILNLDNHTFFNIAAYLLVFVMIYLFDRSQKKSGEESIKKSSVNIISPGKKKILIMIEWFTPGYKAGGPIRSCTNMAFALKEEYQIYILTTDTDHGERKPYNTVPANKWTNAIDPLINVYYAKKATLNKKQLCSEINGIQPDYIYLNNIFSPWFVLYPLWLKYQKKIKAKIILCPRGTLYDSALSLKLYKKKPFLSLLKWTKVYKHILFHATGEREEKAVLKYFPGSNVVIADNLPDIIQPDFYNCEKTPGILKCIFISRIMSIKNILYFLTILQEVKAELYFTIVGPVEDAAYWEECMQQIKKLPGNIKVDYIGPKRHEELTGLLQQHHLFVLPTTGENYGHAIFEALLAGRPVLISDQTPWQNLTDSNAGWDIPLNDPDAFRVIIEQAASWDQYEFDKHALSSWQYAKNNINAREYKKQYFKLFS